MFPRSDDETIGDNDLLLRRIVNTPIWIKSLEDGQVKPSSAAFLDNYNNEVSVNVDALIERAELIDDYPEMGLVSIEAGVPRGLDHIVSKTPEVEDESHRVICPPNGISKSKRKTLARKMAEACNWIIHPESYRI